MGFTRTDARIRWRTWVTVAAALFALGTARHAQAVCGDGILNPSEECDPNCGTPGSPQGCPLHPNGDPALGTCTTGDSCFREFTCCKFNCQFVGTAVPCADGNACTTNDVCNQVGQCLAGTFAAPGSPCGSGTATQCDLPDTCNGAGTCNPNFVGAGTTANTQCTDGNDCTANQCNGSGGCQNPPLPGGSPCGDPASTQCNLADTCNGAGACNANLVAAGTAADVQCTDGNDCTFNQCNGSGGCQNPPLPGGSACGDPTVTECDLADTCNGAGTCLTNPVAGGTAAGTLCGDGNGCTFDQCNGTGGCQHPQAPDGTECRPLAGSCDVAEQCGSGVCPPDAKVAGGTECRASTDACDPAEVCNGVSSTCPADAQLADGTVCRSAAGACDQAEECSAGVCPTDAKLTTECHPSLGPCDPAEVCDGTGDDCPADVALADGSACDDGNDCTIAGTCLASNCEPSGPAFVVTGRSVIFRDSQVNVSVTLDDETGYLGFLRNVFMADDTLVSANRVRLLRGSSAFDVTANLVDGPGVIRGTLLPGFTPSGAGAMCELPPSVCGGSDALVDGDGSVPLSPGSYGTVRVGLGATLSLVDGTYDICSLKVNPFGSIIAQTGQPVVVVSETLRAGRGVTMAPASGAQRPVFYAGRKASFGREANLEAHLRVPSGVLRVGRLTVFNGTICARRVAAFKQVQLSCAP